MEEKNIETETSTEEIQEEILDLGVEYPEDEIVEENSKEGE